ncbi:Microtubule-associated tumor suppressor candidate 2 [Borealophlyctis nickersoniae]|nr:Microtubule-associated tumor suppressor candidate 2 [Borealophlyctis nickersoniae]
MADLQKTLSKTRLNGSTGDVSAREPAILSDLRKATSRSKVGSMTDLVTDGAGMPRTRSKGRLSRGGSATSLEKKGTASEMERAASATRLSRGGSRTDVDKRELPALPKAASKTNVNRGGSATDVRKDDAELTKSGSRSKLSRGGSLADVAKMESNLRKGGSQTNVDGTGLPSDLSKENPVTEQTPKENDQSKDRKEDPGPVANDKKDTLCDEEAEVAVVPLHPGDNSEMVSGGKPDDYPGGDPVETRLSKQLSEQDVAATLETPNLDEKKGQNADEDAVALSSVEPDAGTPRPAAEYAESLEPREGGAERADAHGLDDASINEVRRAIESHVHQPEEEAPVNWEATAALRLSRELGNANYNKEIKDDTEISADIGKANFEKEVTSPVEQVVHPVAIGNVGDMYVNEVFEHAEQVVAAEGGAKDDQTEPPASDRVSANIFERGDTALDNPVESHLETGANDDGHAKAVEPVNDVQGAQEGSHGGAEAAQEGGAQTNGHAVAEEIAGEEVSHVATEEERSEAIGHDTVEAAGGEELGKGAAAEPKLETSSHPATEEGGQHVPDEPAEDASAVGDKGSSPQGNVMEESGDAPAAERTDNGMAQETEAPAPKDNDGLENVAAPAETFEMIEQHESGGDEHEGASFKETRQEAAGGGEEAYDRASFNEGNQNASEGEEAHEPREAHQNPPEGGEEAYDRASFNEAHQNAPEGEEVQEPREAHQNPPEGGEEHAPGEGATIPSVENKGENTDGDAIEVSPDQESPVSQDHVAGKENDPSQNYVEHQVEPGNIEEGTDHAEGGEDRLATADDSQDYGYEDDTEAVDDSTPAPGTLTAMASGLMHTVIATAQEELTAEDGEQRAVAPDENRQYADDFVTHDADTEGGGEPGEEVERAEGQRDHPGEVEHEERNDGMRDRAIDGEQDAETDAHRQGEQCAGEERYADDYETHQEPEEAQPAPAAEPEHEAVPDQYQSAFDDFEPPPENTHAEPEPEPAAQATEITQDYTMDDFDFEEQPKQTTLPELPPSSQHASRPTSAKTSQRPSRAASTRSLSGGGETKEPLPKVPTASSSRLGSLASLVKSGSQHLSQSLVHPLSHHGSHRGSKTEMTEQDEAQQKPKPTPPATPPKQPSHSSLKKIRSIVPSKVEGQEDQSLQQEDDGHAEKKSAQRSVSIHFEDGHIPADEVELMHQHKKKQEVNYSAIVSKLRREIQTLKEQLGQQEQTVEKLRTRERELRLQMTPDEKLERDLMDKNARLVLDRQKKASCSCNTAAYQILVAKLRREIRRLKFQRNSLGDPLIESQYFPYLPRTPHAGSARRPPVGVTGNVQPRSADRFALNPPPPTGNHPESGNRWWWGSGPNLAGHLPPTRPKTAPASNDRSQSSNPSANRTPKLIPIAPASSQKTQDREEWEAAVEDDKQQHIDLHLGDRVFVGIAGERCLGTLKYIGTFDPHPSSGLWCGIALDRPLGKHDGVVRGKRYFTAGENRGLFVKVEKVGRVVTCVVKRNLRDVEARHQRGVSA